MSDNVLTDPLMQQGDLFVLPPQRIVLTTGVWTPVLSPNPQRFAAIFAPVAVGGGFTISPHDIPPPLVKVDSPTPLPTVLHSAVYPLIIAGSWWGTSGADVEVLVYDILRLNR